MKSVRIVRQQSVWRCLATKRFTTATAIFSLYRLFWLKYIIFTIPQLYLNGVHNNVGAVEAPVKFDSL